MSESTTPTPEPMTDAQRAEIGDAAQPGYANILAQLIKHGAHDDPKHGKVIVHGVTVVPAADLKAAVRVVWFGAPALLVEVERLREQVAVVEKFCAERAEYITAINNCNPDNAHDYHRWQGHAEGRRQLSEQLGLPVGWPTGYEQDGDDRG